MESYTIGEKGAPYWCKNRIMPFRRSDGSTGYEYYEQKKVVNLKAGDMLLRGKDNQICIRKKG